MSTHPHRPRQHLDAYVSPALAMAASAIAERLATAPSAHDLATVQILCVAEEAGEVVAAWRRILSHGRAPATLDDLAHELADVIIATHVAAQVIGIDLDTSIRHKLAIIAGRPLIGPPA